MELSIRTLAGKVGGNDQITLIDQWSKVHSQLLTTILWK